MTAQSLPDHAVLDGCRTLFGLTDLLRRAQGQTLEAFGLGPNECPYEIVASGTFWRLRDYGKRGPTQSLLIVAAPIKRPCIWNLAPSASAIRYILDQNFHVHVLEWLPAEMAGENGLAEYAKSISECVERISRRHSGAKAFLMGHSLGGTLAAILRHQNQSPYVALCCSVHHCASNLRLAVSETSWSRLFRRAYLTLGHVQVRFSLI